MKKFDCLCFGACVLDRIENNEHFTLGGDAANQTILLKRLGLNPILCASIGNDDSGQKILNKFNDFKLSTQAMIVDSNLTTTHSIIHLDEAGERSFKVIGGAHRLLDKKHFPFELIPDCKAISLGSMFTLQNLEEDGLKEVFEIAKINHCITFSDTTKDRHNKGLNKVKEFLPYIDYFMPSYDEAVQLTKQTEPDEIAKVLFNHGANTVVLKLGKEGAVLYQKELKLHVHSYPASVINTTGAGDNFCSGFIASILNGKNLNEALENACWMGARATEVNDTTSTDITKLPHPI